MHFRVGRGVDVDHRLQLVDIQPARRHIGGHQHRTTAVGKLRQHEIPLALLQFTEKRQRMESLGLQQRHQVFALLFGVAKRQCADGSKVPQQLTHRLQAVAAGHFIKALLNLAFGLAGGHLHALRLAHELARQFLDAFRVGG